MRAAEMEIEIMLPVVFGDYNGEKHVTLCSRTDEHGVRHEMWYAGNIVNDQVSAVRRGDGSLIQTALPPDGYARGIPSPWKREDDRW